MRGRDMLALALLLWAGRASAQWQTIVPGGATTCSDGSPYRFFVYPADPAKLLIEFEGGGACWNGTTCELDVYNRRVLSDPETARQQGQLQGIYDRTNAENPFRDFTHVYIPYCTGDLHWGNRTASYAGPATGGYRVEHRGAVNAGAALNWASQNVANPSQLFVAGCSAGGYGAILWSARIAERYPGATLRHLSDSAAGIVPLGFFSTLIEAWNPADAWPSFIPSLDLAGLDAARVTLPDLYAGIAGRYPLAFFSQFNTRGDTTQTFFYSLAKGALAPSDAADWSAGMLSNVERIEAENPNFDAYLMGGTQHCIINQSSFYTASVGGRRFVDWVRTLATTGAPGSVR